MTCTTWSRTNRTQALGWAALLGALAALSPEARADEPARPPRWQGTWLVDGAAEGEAPAKRRLFVRGDRVRLAQPLPGHDLVFLEGGPAGADAVELSATIEARTGLAQALVGEREAAARVTVSAALRYVAGEDGERIECALSHDGEVRNETWSRPAWTLELVDVAHPEGQADVHGFDPIEGPLTLKVRAVGDLDLVVDVRHVDDAGLGVAGERARFYRAQGLGRVVRTIEVGRTTTGLHELRWNGRDGSAAERIALAGEYQLEVRDVDDRVEPLRARVRVAAPLALTATIDFTNSHLSNMRPDTFDLYSLVMPEFGFRVDQPRAGFSSAGAFARASSRAAVVSVATHGSKSAFMINDSLDFRAGDTKGGWKDVHYVVLSTCLTARSTVPAELVAAGVDVVLAYDARTLINAAPPFFDDLAVRYLEEGVAVKAAFQLAAAAADAASWYRQGESWRRRKLSEPEGIRPLAMAIQIRTAPGIDPETERLAPARHGCSTN